jgi:hypothetical protein
MSGMGRASLFAFLACAGCGVAEPAVATSTQSMTIEDGCPPKECGSNSSVIDGVYFYELAWSGEPNSEGVRILSYVGLPPGAVKLDVVKNELVARDAFGVQVAWGPGLIGSGMMLEVNSEPVFVRIANYHRTLHYWVKDDGKPLSSYTFEYQVEEVDPQGTTTTYFKPLCTVTDIADGVAALDAFVFEGDRYDPVTKVVTTGALTKGWFNIACMRGAPAKTYRMRATAASSDPLNGVTTTLDQRQSLFNMWVANYCGDGQAFTVPGEPLRVRDATKWIPLSSDWSWDEEPLEVGAEVSSYEAVWGPKGAVCLDVPRRDDSAPGYRSVIADYCKNVDHELPYCSDIGVLPNGWQASGAYATANPNGS